MCKLNYHLIAPLSLEWIVSRKQHVESAKALRVLIYIFKHQDQALISRFGKDVFKSNQNHIYSGHGIDGINTLNKNKAKQDKSTSKLVTI